MTTRFSIAVVSFLSGCATVTPAARLEPSPPLLAGDGRADPAPIPFAPPSGDRPFLAILIDDLGDSIPQAAVFAAVPVPLTFAILPDAAEAPGVARFLGTLGREVLVHAPMEPDQADEMSHPSFLLATMTDDEITGRMTAFLARVPGAVGANNHMGSRFTRDPRRMEVVLAFLRDRGLFFVDSRTSPATVGREVATRVGVPFAERRVFLDNDPSGPEIETRLEEAIRAAHREGCALAIGHPRVETLEVLTRWARDPRRDVDVVPVSRLIAGPCRGDPPGPPRSGQSSGSETAPHPRCASPGRGGP